MPLFTPKSYHMCSIKKQTSRSFLRKLPSDAGRCDRIMRALRKSMLISEHVPRTSKFYRSIAEILQARKEQVVMYPWIIHPYSKFRAYYEMWMTILYFTTLLFTPFESCFIDYAAGTGLEEHFRKVAILITILCYSDVIMHFFTGYTDPNAKRVVMKPRKIFL